MGHFLAFCVNGFGNDSQPSRSLAEVAGSRFGVVTLGSGVPESSFLGPCPAATLAEESPLLARQWLSHASILQGTICKIANCRLLWLVQTPEEGDLTS